MLNDPLSNVLSTIMNKTTAKGQDCVVRPSSTVIKEVLKILKENGYIGGFTEHEDPRGNILQIELINRINQCGVIKPRFSVKADGFEKFEKRFLPAQGFGILVVSTPQGIMTNEEARKRGIGGKLLAYCY